jgi:peptide deformylase
MAIRPIITYPDPRLRLKSAKVENFNSALQTLVEDMRETMIHAKGIGLAAIQIAVAERILVIDIGDLNENDDYVEGDEESEKRLSERKKTSNFEVFINPEILESNGEIQYEEGCLSVPGVYCEVTRKRNLKLRYQDVSGKTHIVETSGLKSIVLQHEMDHLDGIVFPDRLNPIQRMMIVNKYNKLRASKKSKVSQETE